MEWNWNWNVTPFLLLESSGDSEDQLLKPSGVHNHQEKQEADIDESYNQQDDDDDAESCSYDHSSYVINTRRYSCGISNQDQTPSSGAITYDDDDDDDDDDDGDGEVDDGKMMDPCMSHDQFCHQLCGDACSHERETDRKFWETCLAS